VNLGRRPINKADRFARRYFATQIAPALSASAVVVVEGIHDRFAIDSLALRAAAEGLAPSLAGAGIEVIEAHGNGEIAKVVTQCAQLGLYTIALLDNDGPANAPAPAHVTECGRVADVALQLPARTGIERVLTRGLSDADLVSSLGALSSAIPDVQLPAGYEAMTGRDLQRIAERALHDKSGGVHGTFVRALPSISPLSVKLLNRLTQLARERAETGIVGL
jgi:hypothetical protein